MLTKLKDTLALIREGVLIVLFFLLLVFPSCFNTILVNAGFTEGSVMGFTWKEKAIESQKAADSSQHIAETANAKLSEVSTTLEKFSVKVTDAVKDPASANLHSLKVELDSSKVALKNTRSDLNQRILNQRVKMDELIRPK